MEKHTIPGTRAVIYGDRSRFSFGVDAILLSHFYRPQGRRVADFCAGNGIIALRLAALYPKLCLTGVEIQPESAALFRRAVRENGYEQRVEVFEGDVKKFQAPRGSFDSIVANPPYLKAERSLPNQNQAQNLARHEIAITLEELMEKSESLLRPHGSLFMIHRPERLVDLIATGRKLRLEPKRLRSVHSRAHEKPRMILIELVKHGGEHFFWLPPLVLYEGDEKTEEHRRIYGNGEILSHYHSHRQS